MKHKIGVVIMIRTQARVANVCLMLEYLVLRFF